MDATLEKLAQKAGDALKKCKFRLATAESCTGGGLSYWITSITGSSEWFDRGFVTYSNTSKVEILGVNPTTLNSFGAVSESVVREMAEGALQRSEADISIAITGIAGPGGGTSDKPVGTVWIAWAIRDGKMTAQMELYSGNRQAVRDKVMKKALEQLIAIVS